MLPARGSQVLTWTLLSLSTLASALVQPVFKDKPRTFELTLTEGVGAPDGQDRPMILTNGQFPAPMLEMNEGEAIEVTVHNQLPYNTSVHFHGIEMWRTPWSDGMPGLSQRQIPAGADFVYRWTATQYGAYWYHAHERGQVDDGLLGPLKIHPVEDKPRPFHLINDDPKAVAAMLKAEAHAKNLIVGDWRNTTSEEIWDIQVASGIEATCLDSILFNGKGKVDCWSPDKIESLLDDAQREWLAAAQQDAFTAKGCLPGGALAAVIAPGEPADESVIPPSVFEVCTATEGSHEVIEVKKSACDDETWVAIDLVFTFGVLSGTFSIDEHSMWIYAVDGSYIEPEEVDAIPVANGARFSVLVKLGEPGKYSLRFASTSLVQLISGSATLSYIDAKSNATSTRASVPHINDAGDATSPDVVFFRDSTMRMFPAGEISQTSDQTYRLDMRVAGQSYMWALNNSVYPMRLNNEEPLLFDPDPSRHNEVTITTHYDQWIDLIFVSSEAPMPPHPIHKHGNKMYLLGIGEGDFPYETIAEAVEANPGAFNLESPPKRDTWVTLPAVEGPAWMAVRYHVDNPGAWFLHCHIQSHMLGGMGVAIQDGIDQWPTVPDYYLNHS